MDNPQPGRAAVRGRHALQWARTRALSLSAAIVSFAVMVPVARLDPDLHHDGIMSTAAVAFAHLQRPHTDFFAQYGPGSPIIQSIPLMLGVPSVLGLRLVNVLFVSITIFLMVDLGRIAPRSWGLERRSTLLAAGCWFVLADFFVGVTMLPWSSVIATAGVLMSVYFVTVGVQRDEEGAPDRARRMFVAAGVVGSVLPFVRITVGAVYLLTILALLLLCGRSARDPRYSKFARWFVRGTAVGLVAQAFGLLLIGSLAEYFRQSVLWPLRWRAAFEEAEWPLDGLSGSLAKTEVEILLIVGVGLLMFVLRSRSFSPGAEQRVDFATGFLALAVGTLVGVRLYASGSDNTILGMATVNAGLDYSTRGRQNLALLFVLAAAGVLIGLGVLVLICAQRWDRSFVRDHFGIALIGAASMATMSQVWPLPESRHLWWGAALPILTLALWFSGHRRSTNGLILLLAVPLLFAGLAAASTTKSYLGLPRVDGAAGSALAGMEVGQSLSGPVDVAVITETLEGLRTIVGDGEAIFLTRDGFWAGYDGSYHSSDQSFVDWGPVAPLQQRLSKTSVVVMDVGLEPTYATQVEQFGFERIAEYGLLAFYERP